MKFRNPTDHDLFVRELGCVVPAGGTVEPSEALAPAVASAFEPVDAAAKKVKAEGPLSLQVVPSSTPTA